MPPAPPARLTPKATPPADDATVVVTFKGRKNCADTSVPITLGSPIANRRVSRRRTFVLIRE